VSPTPTLMSLLTFIYRFIIWISSVFLSSIALVAAPPSTPAPSPTAPIFSLNRSVSEHRCRKLSPPNTAASTATALLFLQVQLALQLPLHRLVVRQVRIRKIMLDTCGADATSATTSSTASATTATPTTSAAAAAG